ncbi:MAG: type I DNA topoisomerase [Candidatus Omnitrophica bacterium]|nr:type I DNA topoisomerase [Candidatus Omnitrophota bacterium]
MSEEKKPLVIVESPTKAKTIGKFLAGKYNIVSSMGHLIDLPKKNIGIDIEDGFKPSFVVMPSRKKVFEEIKKAVAESDTVYLATDPDREGEAIGWHIMERMKDKKKFLRVAFHEITLQAIKNAFSHPVDINEDLVKAQQARRILDRIVGYLLSPLLWRKIVRGLSAGRVQSVALRLIVEREREIQAFKPQEYWDIEAELMKQKAGALKRGHKSFQAKLMKIAGEKVQINNEKEAYGIINDLKEKSFKVEDVQDKEKRRNPFAPFVTSTMQQDGFNKLKFTAAKTMMVAQQLYEGIELGDEGPVGLITYMRTDSTKVANSAIGELRNFILERFGKEYLPDEPNVYKVKKSAQEAHEAVRPTSVLRTPDLVKSFLTGDQYKLYDLIYKRFVASQMKPAVYLNTAVDITADQYQLVANGSNVVFEGFLAIYKLEEEDEEKKNILPALEKGEPLDLVKLDPGQHFTKPPARFSESSLVKALEENGIGRPSTYAPIIQTIVYRDYVRRQKGYFSATELGMKVCDMLVEYFPKVMDVKFTALMEEELDDIEEGKIELARVLSDFYEPFKQSLDFAQENIKKEIITSDEVCGVCGKPMVIKWGRRGKFLSCSGYPDCKSSKSITTGIKCPQPECGGELIERHSRRGAFYGCSNFPKCRYTANKLPEPEDKDQ